MTNYLKIASINLNLTGNGQSESISWKLYRLFLILFSIYQLIPLIYGVVKLVTIITDGNPHTLANFTPAFYCEEIIAIVILISYTINKSRIEALIVQLMTQLESFRFNVDQDIKAIRRCSLVIVLFNLLYHVFDGILGYLEVVYVPSLDHVPTAALMIRMVNIPEEYYKIYMTLMETFYSLDMAITNLYFGLVIMIVYTLYRSFRRLNINLRSTGRHTQISDLRTAQERHQKLAALVRETSVVFSPALLTLILTNAWQIIAGINVIKRQIQLNHNNDNKVFLTGVALHYSTAIALILILSLMGGKLYNEVSQRSS